MILGQKSPVAWVGRVGAIIAHHKIITLWNFHRTKVIKDIGVVCKTFFANTDANQFLVDMENAARVNPNIDPREASLIATLKYICRWVAGQVQFNKA